MPETVERDGRAAFFPLFPISSAFPLRLCAQKTFKFKNYYETMAFVNASAWISHREDHHPDITVGYNQATVAYMTHAINGISENDFGVHVTCCAHE